MRLLNHVYTSQKIKEGQKIIMVTRGLGWNEKRQVKTAAGRVYQTFKRHAGSKTGGQKCELKEGMEGLAAECSPDIFHVLNTVFGTETRLDRVNGKTEETGENSNNQSGNRR